MWYNRDPYETRQKERERKEKKERRREYRNDRKRRREANRQHRTYASPLEQDDIHMDQHVVNQVLGLYGGF